MQEPNDSEAAIRHATRVSEKANHDPSSRPPLGLRWRSSYWFTTFAVGLGVCVDMLVYTIIIPVIPFQLEKLGYRGVGALTGWMLFAFSAGLVLATIPIAMLSERYNARQIPLVVGLLILIGSLIMLMEAPVYAVMCIARLLQGIGSSMVWTVGLALLCDVTPESLIGKQAGFALTGISAGSIIGPPVGGALYSKFGFRGPFILAIAAAILDLIARLLIIERKEALKWGFDPMTLSVGSMEEPSQIRDPSIPSESKEETLPNNASSGESSMLPVAPSLEQPADKRLSLPMVIVRLVKSSRALVVFALSFVYGAVYVSQEPSLPLYAQQVWGLDSRRVGLIFLAAVVPTLLSSVITGWSTDKFGSEWVIAVSLILALPWWVVVIVKGPLALFTVAFALEIFFTSGVLPPLTSEMAAVSRNIEGIGYAHVYGALNIAYGIGSAIGPIIGGQMYDRVKHGWAALCLLSTGLIVASIVLSFFFIGDVPLGRRLGRLRRVPEQ